MNNIISMQVKTPLETNSAPQPRDYVDAMTYRTGPVTAQKRRNILVAHGFTVPTRKVKKKKETTVTDKKCMSSMYSIYSK